MNAQEIMVDQNQEQIYATNVFRLKFSDENVLFSKYDLILDPPVEDENEKSKLSVRASRILKGQGVRCFSFSTNIFCLNRTGDLKELRLEGDRSNPNPQPINVNFKLVDERKMKDITDENFLYNYIRYLIKEPLKNKGLVSDKSGYINKNNICPGQISQNYQITIREGFKFNLSLVNNNIYLIFDLIYQSEQERTLLEEFNRHAAIVYKKPLKSLTPEELAEMQDYYQGFRVRAKNNGYEYIIEEFALDKTPKDGFTTDEGYISYIDYFKKKYNLSIFDNDQFLILVSKFNNPVNHLPELVNIVDYSFDLDMNSKYQEEIEKIKNKNPKERLETIHRYIDQINGILKPHNIEIVKESVSIKPLIEYSQPLKVVTSSGLCEFKYDLSAIASILEKCVIEEHNPLRTIYALVNKQTEDLWDDFYIALTKMAEKVGLKLPKSVNKIKVKKTKDVPYSKCYIDAIDSLPTNGDFYFTCSYYYEENFIKFAKEKITIGLAKPHIHLVGRNLKTEAYNRKKRIERTLKYKKFESSEELIHCYRELSTKTIIDIASRLNATIWTLQSEFADTIYLGIDNYQAKFSDIPTNLFASIAFDGKGRYLTGAYTKTTDLQKENIPNFMELLQSIKFKIENSELSLVESNIKKLIVIRKDYQGINEEKTNKEDIETLLQFSKETSIEVAYILLKKRYQYRIFMKSGETYMNPRITPITNNDIFDSSEFIILANEPTIGTTNSVYYKILENKTSMSLEDIAISLAKLGIAYPSFLPVQVPAPVHFAHTFVQLFGRILEREPLEDSIDFPDYL